MSHRTMHLTITFLDGLTTPGMSIDVTQDGDVPDEVVTEITNAVAEALGYSWQALRIEEPVA